MTDYTINKVSVVFVYRWFLLKEWSVNQGSVNIVIHLWILAVLFSKYNNLCEVNQGNNKIKLYFLPWICKNVSTMVEMQGPHG